jgi:hypothetical protein
MNYLEGWIMEEEMVREFLCLLHLNYGERVMVFNQVKSFA